MKRIFITALFLVLTSLSAAQEIDDTSISTRVNFAQQNSKALNGSDFLAVSVNGYVLLAGQVLSEEQRNAAAAAAAFASKDIRRLINELEVVDELDYSFDAPDRQILAQIEAVIPAMSSATVPVIHNGMVFLLGRVSRAEGNDVAQQISRMDGVKGVKISYEYID